VLSESYFIAKK